MENFSSLMTNNINNPTPHLRRPTPPSSWTQVASPRAVTLGMPRTVYKAFAWCAPPPLVLPTVPNPSTYPVLTFQAAKALLASPTHQNTASVIAARALLRDIGTPLPLNPTTGNPDPPAPAVSSFAFAPSCDTKESFNIFQAAQNALCHAFALSTLPLPPHVLIPGVGRWTYVYMPATSLQRVLHILSFVRLTFTELCTQVSPLSTESVSNLPASAAGGVARRLTNEAHRLLRRSTSTRVPSSVRNALAGALLDHAQTLKKLLTRHSRALKATKRTGTSSVKHQTPCHPTAMLSVANTAADGNHCQANLSQLPSLPTSRQSDGQIHSLLTSPASPFPCPERPAHASLPSRSPLHQSHAECSSMADIAAPAACRDQDIAPQTMDRFQPPPPTSRAQGTIVPVSRLPASAPELSPSEKKISRHQAQFRFKQITHLNRKN